jgi:acetylornithine deacetylase/succinyl-diaminopimelate desuccinylase-like protein
MRREILACFVCIEKAGSNFLFCVCPKIDDARRTPNEDTHPASGVKMRPATSNSVLPTPIALLKEFIKIRSLFSQSPYETVIAGVIENYLTQMGFQVTRQPVHTPAYKAPETPTRYNLLAEKGSGDRALLIYGHMDTFNIVEGWQRNPLSATQEGDRIYGLGAYHAKAGLSAILHAAESAQPKGYVLKLAFLADEVNLQVGAHCLSHSLWMKDVQAALTPEFGTFDAAALGPRMIRLGTHGHMTLQITIYSVNGNDVSAYLGQNILGVAHQLIDNLEDERRKRDALVNQERVPRRGNFSVRAFHSEPDNHPSTSVSTTIILDRQLAARETREDACMDIRRIIAAAFFKLPIECRIRLSYTISVLDTGNPYLLPHITSAAHPFVDLVKNSVQNHVGLLDVATTYSSSLADNDYYSAIADATNFAPPTVIVSPIGQDNPAHDEWVSAQSIHQLIAIYRDVIQKYETLNQHQNHRDISQLVPEVLV